MKTEDMRPVPGFPGYFATTTGDVVSLKRDEPRALSRTFAVRDGCARITLQAAVGTSLTSSRCRTSASIVCTAFHGPRPSKHHVAHHEDGDVRNDRPDNLRWRTQTDVNRLRAIKALKSVRIEALTSALGSVVAGLQRDEPVEDVARAHGLKVVTVQRLRTVLLGLVLNSRGLLESSAPAGTGDLTGSGGKGSKNLHPVDTVTTGPACGNAGRF
jgi:hypothetical protein